MALIIEGGRVPSHWADRRSNSVVAIDSHVRRGEGISLALINNMPDPALEDTELQFFDLLDIASGDIPVYLKLFSLAGVPRTDRGERHLNSFYHPFNELWQNRFDGVIVTGTEPHHANLRDEPYWNLLAEVFDWAERNTNSTVLSCLAAHAGVLHSDGIKRHRLPDKKFGVFESVRNGDHALIAGIEGNLRFPHSRWNEVREEELAAAGYDVLTHSAQAGVDLFVKRKRKSLFVHFQGHPEYGAQTLLKEYRRDIKRFLRGERETYPSMPFGYFNPTAVELLNQYREGAMIDRYEGVLDSLIESVAKEMETGWKASAIGVYCNWLGYLAARKLETSAFAAYARVAPSRPRAVGNEIA